MNHVIRIGSRPSPLAKAQVEEIIGLLHKKGTDVPYTAVILKTQGDKDKTTPLTRQPADNFFTDACKIQSNASHDTRGYQGGVK